MELKRTYVEVERTPEGPQTVATICARMKEQLDISSVQSFVDNGKQSSLVLYATDVIAEDVARKAAEACGLKYIEGKWQEGGRGQEIKTPY